MQKDERVRNVLYVVHEYVIMVGALLKHRINTTNTPAIIIPLTVHRRDN